MKNFIDINPFYPDHIESDTYMIFKNILTEENLALWTHNVGKAYRDKVKVGKEYVVLLNKELEKTMMSNHESETITNQKFLDSAKGDVLIFGLGIGLIVFPLLEDPEINSITIVEVDESLIGMVSPIIESQDFYKKVKVISGNCFTWETQNKFDTIYFDIWEEINEKSHNEMGILNGRYQKSLKEGGWIDSWCSELNKK